MDYFEYIKEENVINSETLLDFALFCINHDEVFEESLAHEILVSYVLHRFDEENEEYGVEEVFEECEQLVINHANAKLVKDGLLVPDFSGEELTYDLTESGRERLELEIELQKEIENEGTEKTTDNSSSEEN